ncbi:hypothetical protein CYMTET_48427 [Cymbomonas tetramitiformis]|uniref:Uncharacterized protein n=1 Tax=Cymbomonas tetramitiformis TaxID=36881 RepID=A0AAE0BSA2_9CHLO|nr:hypothetical protein CYMTET_48427 [Cymbomonas tetramitiformis]
MLEPAVSVFPHDLGVCTMKGCNPPPRHFPLLETADTSSNPEFCERLALAEPGEQSAVAADLVRERREATVRLREEYNSLASLAAEREQELRDLRATLNHAIPELEDRPEGGSGRSHHRPHLPSRSAQSVASSASSSWSSFSPAGKKTALDLKTTRMSQMVEVELAQSMVLHHMLSRAKGDHGNAEVKLNEMKQDIARYNDTQRIARMEERRTEAIRTTSEVEGAMRELLSHVKRHAAFMGARLMKLKASDAASGHDHEAFMNRVLATRRDALKGISLMEDEFRALEKEMHDNERVKKAKLKAAGWRKGASDEQSGETPHPGEALALPVNRPSDRIFQDASAERFFKAQEAKAAALRKGTVTNSVKGMITSFSVAVAVERNSAVQEALEAMFKQIHKSTGVPYTKPEQIVSVIDGSRRKSLQIQVDETESTLEARSLRLKEMLHHHHRIVYYGDSPDPTSTSDIWDAEAQISTQEHRLQGLQSSTARLTRLLADVREGCAVLCQRIHDMSNTEAMAAAIEAVGRRTELRLLLPNGRVKPRRFRRSSTSVAAVENAPMPPARTSRGSSSASVEPSRSSFLYLFFEKEPPGHPPPLGSVPAPIVEDPGEAAKDTSNERPVEPASDAVDPAQRLLGAVQHLGISILAVMDLVPKTSMALDSPYTLSAVTVPWVRQSQLPELAPSSEAPLPTLAEEPSVVPRIAGQGGAAANSSNNAPPLPSSTSGKASSARWESPHGRREPAAGKVEECRSQKPESPPLQSGVAEVAVPQQPGGNVEAHRSSRKSSDAPREAKRSRGASEPRGSGTQTEPGVNQRATVASVSAALHKEREMQLEKLAAQQAEEEQEQEEALEEDLHFSSMRQSVKAQACSAVDEATARKAAVETAAMTLPAADDTAGLAPEVASSGTPLHSQQPPHTKQPDAAGAVAVAGPSAVIGAGDPPLVPWKPSNPRPSAPLARRSGRKPAAGGKAAPVAGPSKPSRRSLDPRGGHPLTPQSTTPEGSMAEPNTEQAEAKDPAQASATSLTEETSQMSRHAADEEVQQRINTEAPKQRGSILRRRTKMDPEPPAAGVLADSASPKKAKSDLTTKIPAGTKPPSGAAKPRNR